MPNTETVGMYDLGYLYVRHGSSLLPLSSPYTRHVWQGQLVILTVSPRFLHHIPFYCASQRLFQTLFRRLRSLTNLAERCCDNIKPWASPHRRGDVIDGSIQQT